MAVNVGEDAAHEVVGGGTDGDEVAVEFERYLARNSEMPGKRAWRSFVTWRMSR